MGPRQGAEYGAARLTARAAWVLLVLAGIALMRPWTADPVVSGDTVSTAVGALAGLICLYVAFTSHGRRRVSWLLFGTTMAMWTVADLLWLALGTAEGAGSVLSVADALYLLGLIPASLGLVVYPVGKGSAGARARLMLDVLVLGTALLLASTVLVLGEVVSTVGTGWDAFVYIVYPVTDVLLAGLAVLLLLRTAGNVAATWRCSPSPSRRGRWPTTATPCCPCAARTTRARSSTWPTSWLRHSWVSRP